MRVCVDVVFLGVFVFFFFFWGVCVCVCFCFGLCDFSVDCFVVCVWGGFFVCGIFFMYL